ncbi:hypothetical protein N7486_001689 [Penicillium sp. IBT 16267x]|nr:hypothetical protein N7486_001689 [Penicillium sp. IBT 16267x]
MYPALTKRHLLMPSAARITQLSRASVHNKAHINIKTEEQYFVTATFPDDFENSSLLKQELEQRKAEAEASTGPWDKATIEAHKKDIFESLYPPEVAAAKAASSTSKKKKAEPDPERAPELDEM